jgi:hypothetical protein
MQVPYLALICKECLVYPELEKRLDGLNELEKMRAAPRLFARDFPLNIFLDSNPSLFYTIFRLY